MLLGAISIPPFSPRNDKIFPAIYFALIRISDPAFGSRSDLRYVPTLRTFLHINFFCSGREPRPRVGSPGPGCTCRPKRFDFSRDFSPRFFPAIFPRDFPPRFSPAIFPRDFSPRFFPAIFPRDFSPRFFPANFLRDFSPLLIKEKMSIGLTVSWLLRCRWCAQLRRSSRRSRRGA